MQRNLQVAFADSKSISKKSAKTLKSINRKKIAQEESNNFEPIYFKYNPLVAQMSDRVENMGAKTPPIGKPPGHFTKAENIMQELFQRHRQTKEKLQMMKEQAQKKTEQICPFQPQRNGKPAKFTFTGDVVRRNEIWLQQKRRKQAEMKESQMFQDLSQCTFTPTIVSRIESTQYRKKRENTTSFRQKSRHEQTSLSPYSIKKDISPAAFETGKKQIYDRLNTLRS